MGETNFINEDVEVNWMNYFINEEIADDDMNNFIMKKWMMMITRII